mmetsp:Transcript_2396/g.4192  ORF Transcript_2396/g.4192 Transcript_2396/m.4192 type:complete len:221 (-) Transcript_2396:656-1318(-)
MSLCGLQEKSLTADVDRLLRCLADSGEDHRPRVHEVDATIGGRRCCASTAGQHGGGSAFGGPLHLHRTLRPAVDLGRHATEGAEHGYEVDPVHASRLDLHWPPAQRPLRRRLADRIVLPRLSLLTQGDCRSGTHVRGDAPDPSAGVERHSHGETKSGRVRQGETRTTSGRGAADLASMLENIPGHEAGSAGRTRAAGAGRTLRGFCAPTSAAGWGASEVK